MQKSYPATEFEPPAFGLPLIKRLEVRIQWEDNFFALLVLSSRRSGDSYVGFRADSL